MPKSSACPVTLMPLLVALVVSLISANGFARPPAGPTPVKVTEVQRQAFGDRLQALGNAKSKESTIITADITEKIREIHFKDGQTVNKGDLLVTLDASEEVAQMRALKAELGEVQAAYDRAADLRRKSAVSAATLQERQAALERTRADIEALQTRIDQRSIRAPFSGVLGLREVSVGALVKPGDLITTLDDYSEIKVDFAVPSVYLSQLRTGLEISATVDAYPDMNFQGVVTSISPQVDRVTRSLTARAIFENPGERLRPGLLMKVSVLSRPRESLLVPEESIIKRGAKNTVYVIVENEGKTQAEARLLTLGSRRPGQVEVLDGVEAGERVVVHGTLKLKPGAEVVVQ